MKYLKEKEEIAIMTILKIVMPSFEEKKKDTSMTILNCHSE